jgi:hypothetical protein
MNQCSGCRHFENGLLRCPEEEQKDFCWKHNIGVWTYDTCEDWEAMPKKLDEESEEEDE